MLSAVSYTHLDVYKRQRYAGVTWEKDNSGFYYGRHPKPGTVPPGEENYNRHLFYHKLGTDPKDDPKVFGEGRPREQSYGTSLSDDGKYLLLVVSHGWNKTDLYFRDETASFQEFKPIIEGQDAIFHGRIIGETLYMITNFEAPRYKVVSVDLNKPSMENWTTVIPESRDLTIEGAEFVKGHIVLSVLKDAVSYLHIHKMDGQFVKEIQLPTLGTITGLTGDLSEPEFFFAFESFLIPPAIYLSLIHI